MGKNPRKSAGPLRRWLVRMVYGCRGPVGTRGYLVLGMHRSGTSCLTGLLETAGVRLCRVPRWNRFNPKGNLEDDRVWNLNEAILRRCDGAWHSPPPSVPESAAEYGELRAALQPYTRIEPWAIKDPRMVLTLHLWLPLLPKARLIGTYRHPVAVAESLRTRNKMPLEEGIELWYAYNRRLVEWHKRRRFPIISFDVYGDRYLSQFERLCAELNLRYEEAKARGFYCQGFVNHRPVPDYPLPDHVRRLYEYLVANSLLGQSGLRQAG